MPVRAREIRERLRGKVEPELLVILEAMAEDYGTQQQEILRLATMLDEMIDNYINLAGALSAISDAPAVQYHLNKLKQEQQKATASIESVRKGDKHGLDS